MSFATAFSYALYFFNSSYPNVYDPMAAVASSRQGASSPSGTLTFSETLASLGLPTGDACPKIYSVSELTADTSGGGQAAPAQAVINATITQPTPWTPGGPSPGWWAAAYSDDIVDFAVEDGRRIADKYSYNVNPLTLSSDDLWYHGTKLNSGWRLCGDLSSAGAQLTWAVPPCNPGPGPSLTCAQTWPIRLSSAPLGGPQAQDLGLLLGILRNPDVRNFYGLGHGNEGCSFLGKDVGDYSSSISHRYRFAFIDGCQTARGGDLPLAFGATDYESAHPAYPASDWSVLSPDMNYYNSTGFRPGAFLGWKSPTWIWFSAYTTG